MESKISDHLNELRGKIKRIITLYEKQKTQNSELKIINRELKDRVLVLEKRLSEMGDSMINTQLAKVLLDSEGGTHEAKTKVNKIVRELDKCIALLNR